MERDGAKFVCSPAVHDKEVSKLNEKEKALSVDFQRYPQWKRGFPIDAMEESAVRQIVTEGDPLA